MAAEAIESMEAFRTAAAKREEIHAAGGESLKSGEVDKKCST